MSQKPLQPGISARHVPKTWPEVVGQAHVTLPLAAMAQAGVIPPFFVLAGPPGVGKSSVAAIFAQEATGNPPESVPAVLLNIPERLNAVISRMYGQERTVWVLEEAHTLDQAAWVSLARLFDDPPPNSALCFVTTYPEQLWSIVRVRSLVFGLRRLKSSDMEAKIDAVCENEGLVVSEAARERLLEVSNGSLRRAYTVLEQAVWLTDGPVLPVHVDDVVGAADEATLYAVLRGVLVGDVAALEQVAEQAHAFGVDIDRFFLDMQALLALCLRYRLSGALPDGLSDQRARFVVGMVQVADIGGLKEALQGLWDLHARLQTLGSAAYAALLTGLLLIARIKPAQPAMMQAKDSRPVTAQQFLAMFEAHVTEADAG